MKRVIADPPVLSTPVARISLSAVRANARGLAKGSTVGIAADALGHGADEIATVLSDLGFVPDAGHVENADHVLGLADGGVPAMRLSGTVLSVKPLRAGEGVSYGYTHRAPRDTRVALVVGGYAQGIVRALGGRASVTVAGERHALVGRVAMDVCVIDVEDSAVARGDEVVFFGDPARREPSVAEWVTATGLTALEIVTAVGLRAQREWM
ncbi:MAG: alanine racemase C-terminal domain-containing protein [Microbacterium sp.]